MRRPRVQGDHGGPGTDRSARRLHDGGITGAEARDGCVLEQANAPFQEHAAHPAREAPGMHRRAHLPEQGTAEHRRGDARAHLLGRQDLEVLVDAEAVGGDDPVSPAAHLVVGGGHHVLAVGAVPGVDPVVLAEASDPSHAVLARLAERDRGSVAESSREVLDVAPERVHEAAVAAARAAAGDVLLEDHDVDPGVELLEVEGGPHARVTPAEDHDVGGRVTAERRRGFAGIVGERVAQPPASAGVGGDG